jgi:small multidrug resistance pump
MNPWILLGLAIAAEVVGTSALKASEGFSKLWPSAIVMVSYGAAFYLLSLTLRTIPVGVAYAVWSGVGVVLIALIGWLVFGQKLDAAGMLGMGLIVAGVLVLNLLSKT